MDLTNLAQEKHAMHLLHMCRRIPTKLSVLIYAGMWNPSMHFLKNPAFELSVY